MGYAAVRVRWFRMRFHNYQDKYEQLYKDYKVIKAELDTIKKIKPDGGWFRDGGMGIHPDNIRAE